MQIDSGLSSTLSGLDRVTLQNLPVAVNGQADGIDAIASSDAQDAQGGASDWPSQDDAVTISAEGAATAAQDAAAGDTVADESTGDITGDAAQDGASAVKSFAYGTLGLERPDQPQEDTNSFYTAGRWLAAGITIGGLISLMV